MPRYEITSPDGKRFEVTAPEGASQDEVLAYAKQHFNKTPDRVGGTPTLFDPASGGKLKEAAGFVPAFIEGQLRGAGGMLGSIAGGAAAVPRVAYNLLTGEGLDNSIAKGVETIGKGAEFGRAPNIKGYGIPEADVFGGARATEEATGEAIAHGVGKIAEGVEGAVPDFLGDKTKAFVRSGTEAATNAGLMMAGLMRPTARNQANKTAAIRAKEAEANALQDAKAREEARRAMGNEDFQGRQGGEVDFSTVPPEPYNPTTGAKVPQGRNVNLDKIDQGLEAGSFEQGTKPNMRVGPLATDPLKRTADLPATPEPATSIPETVFRAASPEEAAMGMGDEGSRRSTQPYTWKYKKESVPEGETPKLGDRAKDPNGIEYTPEEIIYDNAPDKVGQQRQQALTEREGIPFEVVKIAEDQANRAAKIAEAEGGFWERSSKETLRALQEAQETGRKVGETARENAEMALAAVREVNPDHPNLSSRKRRMQESYEVYSAIAKDHRAESVFSALAKNPHLTAVEKVFVNLLAKTLDQAGIIFKIASADELATKSRKTLKEFETVEGLYVSEEGAIYLRDFNGKNGVKDWPSSIKTVIHEGVHAVMADWQRIFPNRPESRLIRYLYEKAWKADMAKTGKRDKSGDRYGFTDELEFLAEVSTNPEFRNILTGLYLTPYERTHVAALLSQTKSTIEGHGKIRTAFDALVAAAGAMIGWKGDVQHLGRIAFDASLYTLKSMERPGGALVRDTRTLYNQAVSEGKFDLNGKLTEPLANLLDKSSLPYSKPQMPRTTKDIIGAATGETRMPSKVVDSLGGKVAELPDSLFVSGLAKYGSISKLFTETGNPMLRWAYEFASNSRNMAGMKAERLKEGASFKFGMVEGTKVVDPNAPVPRLKKLIGDSKNMRKFVEAVNEFSGKKMPRESELLSRGMSQVAADTFKVVQKSLEEALAIVNEARVGAGMKPINQKVGFFPRHYGEGPWEARVRNDKGTGEWFHKFQTKGEADAVAAEMAAKIGGKAEVTMGSPELRGNKYNANTSVLEHILDTMQQSDPRRAMIESAAKEIMGKRGFAVHSAFRKDQMMGGEYRTTGGKFINKVGSDFLKAYEDYIDGAYRYAENLKVTKAIAELQADKRIPPELNTYLQNYLNRTRGHENPGAAFKDTEAWLNRAWGGVMGKTGIKNIPGVRQVLEKLNQAWMTSTLLVWNPGFTVGNLVQSTVFTTPILAHWKYNLGYKGNVISSFLNGYKEMFSKNTEFAKYRDEYALPRGEIDPTFIQEEGTLFNNRFVKQGLDWGGGIVLNRKAESFSRLHAHSSAFHFMEQAGLKGKELYSAAESMANDIMVNYKKQDKAAIIENLGVMGTAIKPLWSFQNWYFSTTATLIRNAFSPEAIRNPKKMIPLFAEVMATGLFAGILGSTAWTVLDTMWNLLRDSWLGNKLFGVRKTRTSLSEWAMSNLPDEALFGMLDASTKLVDPRGAHIAGGLMSPELKIPELAKDPVGYAAQGGFLKSAPGVKFGVDVMDALITSMMQLFGKDVPSGVMREKAKNIIPGFLDRTLDYFDLMGMEGQEWILRDSNLPRPSAGTRNFAGPIQDKDAYERGVHVTFGNTLEQEREARAFRESKKATQEISKERQKVVDLLVDNLQHGVGDFDKLVDKATELGYSGRELNQAIREAYRNRLVGEDDRRAKGKSTARRMETERIREMTGQ